MAKQIFQIGVCILSLLVFTGLLAPRLSNREYCGHSKTASDISEIRNAINRFRLACDRYPTDAEGLSVLTEGKAMPGWEGPYLDRQLSDPWGRPYLYKYLGPESFQVWSNGADGRPGGDGEDEDVGID